MKRKTSLIVWGAVLLLAAYGIYDLVREVRRSYTSCYAHTYSHAIGQMMGPRFDSLAPRGEGIRIGVVDAGFGGLRDDRFTRRLRVADYLDLTDGDTTGFFRDDCDHGTRVTRNIGGFSNDTLLGLACKADYYLVKSALPPQIRVEYLHGKMKANQKEEIMARFAARETDVLVSTTVIEVGVNVPNATVMMVENADRFGLAQLHQLRGRVGRGKYQSYCIFVSGSDTAKAKDRLGILNQTNDGFKIAEEDLKQRGPGDFFGVRQSGDLRFKIGDIFSDSKVLKEAADAAGAVLAKDELLSSEENVYLKTKVEEYTKECLENINL